MDVSSRRNCAKETGTGFSMNSSASSSSSGGFCRRRRRASGTARSFAGYCRGLTLAMRGALVLDTCLGLAVAFLGAMVIVCLSESKV